MKRFYRTVETTEDAAGYRVSLDGKPVRTPGRFALVLPTRPLAEAVAAEWHAQGDHIQAAAMPLTKLANTAIDRVRPNRTQAIEEVAVYGRTDLLCYRAAAPPDLAALQAERWQPLLDWLGEEHGAALAVTTEVAPLAQPDEALLAIYSAVARFGDFDLAGLHAATTAAGSVVLALALAHGRVGAVEVSDLALLDELYQSERWGVDAEAEQRRTEIRYNIAAAAEFMILSRAG